MICFNCGKEINIDFSKIPREVKTFDTKCPNCDSFVKIGNPNYNNMDKNFECSHESSITKDISIIEKELLTIEEENN